MAGAMGEKEGDDEAEFDGEGDAPSDKDAVCDCEVDDDRDGLGDVVRDTCGERLTLTDETVDGETDVEKRAEELPVCAFEVNDDTDADALLDIETVREAEDELEGRR
jgi:hypothetical protein